MTSFSTLLFLAFISTCLFEALSSAVIAQSKDEWIHNPLINRKDRFQIREMSKIRQHVIDNGCDTNLCFALDGSDVNAEGDYQNQKDFIDLIISITTTDQPANYCAVQYHSRNKPISRLTGNKVKFLQRIHNSQQQGGRSNLAAGIRYAANQLKEQKGDANKIIVLGDGVSTEGWNPNRAARRFMQSGGAICAVQVGSADSMGLAELTGRPERVVGMDGFFDLSEIIVKVVEDICELKKAPFKSIDADNHSKTMSSPTEEEKGDALAEDEQYLQYEDIVEVSGLPHAPSPGSPSTPLPPGTGTPSESETDTST